MRETYFSSFTKAGLIPFNPCECDGYLVVEWNMVSFAKFPLKLEVTKALNKLHAARDYSLEQLVIF